MRRLIAASCIVALSVAPLEHAMFHGGIAARRCLREGDHRGHGSAALCSYCIAAQAIPRNKSADGYQRTP
jgi:hypothetical protein